MKHDGLSVLAGVGLYVDTPTAQPTRATTCAPGSVTSGADGTALRHLYLAGAEPRWTRAPLPAFRRADSLIGSHRVAVPAHASSA